MKNRFLPLFTVAILSLAPFLPLSAAGNPKNYMAGLSSEIRSMLEAGEVRRANGIFADHFDMPKFGERCLAVHWNEFTPEERQRFAALLGKNIKHRMGEKMLFTEDDKNFVLRTVEIRRESPSSLWIINSLKVRNGDFKLAVALINHAGDYRIVDMEIEGALLSRNYMGQFNYLMRKYGKAGLFDKMEDRLARQTP